MIDLTVRFRPDLPEHSQRLMAALGVNVVFDEQALERCECDGCRSYREHDRAGRVRAWVRAGVCPRHKFTQPCPTCQQEGVEP